MAWSVSVAVLSIHICAFSKQRVDHMVVAANAGDVQWCAHCLGSTIQVTAVLGEYFDQVDVSLVRSHVEWSPAVAIALVKQCLSQLTVLVYQDVVAGAVVSLLTSDPYVPEELFLVPSRLLLEEVSLAHAFLCCLV